jgi:putative transposase
MKKIADKGTRIKQRMALQAMTEEQVHFEEEMATIQALIGLGMKAATERIQKDFKALIGQRYEHGKPMGPWGSNRGSIYLADQKVMIKVPRARNPRTGEEGRLASYERLQSPQLIEAMALKRVINGVSMRKYEEAALSIPETFGISRDSVSRRWIKASAKKLATLNDRSLAKYDIVAIFLDGKYFSTDHEIVVALGVTLTGEKIILGMIETSTENYAVCRDFVRGLMDRGLNVENPILCIIDGGKGLHKGLKEGLGDQAVIQRCQWHKRENVLSYLSKSQQEEFRRKLQGAYEQPTYEAAKKTLEAIKRELRVINVSAVNSLEEGFEETLTLHRLGLFEKLGRGFKTTNAIENVNSLLGIYTDRVDHWKNSEQRQRWVATALLQIEPRLRTVNGYQHLPELRIAMALLVGKQKKNEELKTAA